MLTVLKYIIHSYNIKNGTIQPGLDGGKEWNKQETTS